MCGAWAETPGFDDFHGLSLWGVDGSPLRVPDSEENFEYFGKPGGRGGKGDAGYPQARIVWLMNLRNRLLADVRFGPYSTNEQRLAADLWQAVPDGLLGRRARPAENPGTVPHISPAVTPHPQEKASFSRQTSVGEPAPRQNRGTFTTEVVG